MAFVHALLRISHKCMGLIPISSLVFFFVECSRPSLKFTQEIRGSVSYRNCGAVLVGELKRMFGFVKRVNEAK